MVGSSGLTSDRLQAGEVLIMEEKVKVMGHQIVVTLPINKLGGLLVEEAQCCKQEDKKKQTDSHEMVSTGRQTCIKRN